MLFPGFIKENIRKYKATSLAGLFVLGSNGENKSLTQKEKFKILETVIENRAETQVVMAGTGCESTRETISFSREVARMGVDCISVVTPFYFKKRMTDDALVAFFADVADAVEVPVLIYNAPGFTGVTISPAAVKRLAGHPNIIGMKDSSGGDASAYLQTVKNADFKVLSGSISTLFPAMTLGATGGVVSLADAFPTLPCRLYEMLAVGDLDVARPLHYTLYTLNHAVSGSFGVAGVKYAMELGGYFGGSPRRPLLPLTEKERAAIRTAVENSGVL